jgi:hypothetical protein
MRQAGRKCRENRKRKSIPKNGRTRIGIRFEMNEMTMTTKKTKFDTIEGDELAYFNLK